MAYAKIENVEIAGISACVPSSNEHNFNLDFFSDQENELFIKTTGIESRRKANTYTTTSDLCLEAAKKLVSELNWNKDEIEILIFVSQTPDYITPATATILQNKLGLSKKCIAFDVNLGCSGYVYGLHIISSIISSAKLNKGLLLVGDTTKNTVSKNDRSVYPIFGDAGSATALQFNKNYDKIVFNLETDGSEHEAIIIKDGGNRNPFNAASLDERQIGKGIRRNNTQLELKGIDIFNFSTTEVPLNISNLLTKFKIELSDIDYFIFHQANKLINKTIASKLKIEQKKTPTSLKDYGNTSSASIPLTIVTKLKQQLINKDKKLLLAGFGVGLSWGSCVLNLKSPLIPDLIEYE